MVIYFIQVGLLIDVGIGQSVCGGTIISTTRILTAAHCQHDGVLTARSYIVVLGTDYLFSGGTRIETSQAVMHPQWSPITAVNDIAVLPTPAFTLSRKLHNYNIKLFSTRYCKKMWE